MRYSKPVQNSVLPLAITLVLLTGILPGIIHADGAGILENVSSSPVATLGSDVRITGLFRNMENKTVTAKIMVEVFLEGRFMDYIESDGILVQPHDSEQLRTYYSPRQLGRYEIHITVYYSGEETPSRISYFEVVSGPIPLEIGIAALVFIVICMGLIYKIRSMIRRSKFIYPLYPSLSKQIKNRIVSIKKYLKLKDNHENT